MTATQFSLEEENFYKDIQDLVKKGSENEKELSTFLQRYMDLLARADLDDETFIINFTKAALILEASAKVYGSKVDRLWINLERVLEALKVNGKNGKKKPGSEEDVDDVDGEVPIDDSDCHKKLPNPRRKRKLGDALSSPDDFLEIDNISGLLGKNMNETGSIGDNKIKFHEEIPNLFIRNKTDRKRIDVCLSRSTDDRDDSRLRDWIISEENMLVKEIYMSHSEIRPASFQTSPLEENINFVEENHLDNNSVYNSDNDTVDNDQVETENLGVDNLPDDTNNNVENVPDATLQKRSLRKSENEKCATTENEENATEELNRSQEVDLGKFPNIFLRRLDDCLVDVNEVFWNSTKFQDVIPARKMRIKKTIKPPCKLCCKKESHLKKGKRCHMFDKSECLDSFFSPLVQPTVSDPTFGVLPDEELYNAYKIEMKLIEQLGKVDKSRNIYEAYHPEENHDDVTSFLGFNGFENRLMRKEADLDDYDLADDIAALEVDDDNPEVPGQEIDLELPLPTTAVGSSNCLTDDLYIDSPDLSLEQSKLEYQNIICGALRNQEVAKSQFERNKELGMKIAKWHASLVRNIDLSQKRGALNMDMLARNIMKSFPGSTSCDNPMLTFKDLVKNQCRRDIPRYFFACLQLANEGNINISKSNSSPLATDCMIIEKLRATRVRHELDEYTTVSNSPKRIDKSRSLSSCSSPVKRKRDSVSFSSSDSESPKPIKNHRSRTNNDVLVRKAQKRGLHMENEAKKKRLEEVVS